MSNPGNRAIDTLVELCHAEPEDRIYRLYEERAELMDRLNGVEAELRSLTGSQVLE